MNTFMILSGVAFVVGLFFIVVFAMNDYFDFLHSLGHKP